jgi:hypothetical protein
MEFPRSSLSVLTAGLLYSQEILNNKIEIQNVSSYVQKYKCSALILSLTLRFLILILHSLFLEFIEQNKCNVVDAIMPNNSTLYIEQNAMHGFLRESVDTTQILRQSAGSCFSPYKFALTLIRVH